MNEKRAELKDRLQLALDLREKKAADLSRDLNIPKSAISQYLSGKSQKMNSDRLFAISRYLNVSEPWLLGFDVPMESMWDIEQIEAASQQIEDKNTYSDQVELALKSLFEEFGEMALSPEDIRLIRDYANNVKGNEETLRYMAKARRTFVELNLNEEETEKLIEYAEFLVSKRKS